MIHDMVESDLPLQVATLLEQKAVLLRLEAGSTEAGFLAAFCTLDKVPAFVAIQCVCLCSFRGGGLMGTGTGSCRNTSQVVSAKTTSSTGCGSYWAHRRLLEVHRQLLQISPHPRQLLRKHIRPPNVHRPRARQQSLRLQLQFHPLPRRPKANRKPQSPPKNPNLQPQLQPLHKTTPATPSAKRNSKRRKS